MLSAPDRAGLTRLKARREFLAAARGPSERRKSVVVQALPTGVTGRIGVGFTATRKVGGAVTRNRAKRRLREAARLMLPRHGLDATDYVLIARRDTASIAWTRLLDDVESALLSLARRLTKTDEMPDRRSGAAS